MNIGNKIRKIRELKGYTQDHMALQLEISQKTYSQLENQQAKLDIDRLNAIAKILEVDLSEILSFDEKTVFNNNFHDKVENSQNYVLNQNNLEMFKSLYEEQINLLKDEIKFLREQLAK